MSRSPSPVLRRAQRTYGRRRNTSEHDLSFDVGNTSLDSREDPNSSTSLVLDHDLPPSSDDFDASNASYESAHAPDADASDDNDNGVEGGPSKFRFAWQDKMDEIDRGIHDSAEDPDAQMLLAELVKGKASVPTRPASPADLAKEAFSGTLDSLTSSAQSSSLVIHTRAPRRLAAAPPSEPESDVEVRPSTPLTSPRHPINTPETRSSPTPPTSVDMPPRKGKGKQRDANPLPFESVDHLRSSSNSSMAKPPRKGKAPTVEKRVKAPTKKERVETQKATARIVAQQQVSIAPVQSKIMPLSNLFHLVHMQTAARSRSRSRTPPIPLTSDPIQPFSSPMADDDESRPIASSSKATTQREFVSNGLLEPKAQSADESDSSLDLPDGSKLFEEPKRKQLEEMKALAMARRASIPAEDSDDDLIIEDGPRNVAHDEAQTRRGLTAKGVLPSRGRKTQLTLARAGQRRESAAFLAMDDEEARQVLETVAQPTFRTAKSKGTDKPVQMDISTLNQILLKQDDKAKIRTIHEKEEEWKRRGGRIKERPEAHAQPQSAQAILQDIVEKRRSALDRDDVVMVEDSGSDEEYNPDDAADQASDAENDENALPSSSPGDPGEQADDEEEGVNPFLVPRARAPLGRRAVKAVVSDDEDMENQPLTQDNPSPVPAGASAADRSLAHRGSVSSSGEVTEDGTDKENDVRLSFDRGEDKENTVIAMQSPGRSLLSARGFGSLFAEEIAASPGAGMSVPEEMRSPLRELPAADDDEDAFFSPGPLILSRSTPAVTREAREDSLTLDLGSGSGLQAAFAMSAKGKERATSPDALPLEEALPIGGGGFSQFFTQEGGGGFEKLKAAQRDDDISLTLDTGLQPALEVDQSLAEKADQIFEKEQELAVQEQEELSRIESSRELFEDENGFLTQTRPELRTPLTMMTPSQPMGSMRLSSPASLLASLRKPLAPLFAQGPDDDDDDNVPRRRLRKRNTSPSPALLPSGSPSRPRNAFDILGKRRTPPKTKKFVKSAYVQGEAEESDEDAAIGFGGMKQDDDEEEEDDDAQDQPLPGLVDDKEMDDATLAEQLVMEKLREHLEQDDKLDEKIAKDAVTGVLRIKRKDHGVGFDGSDSEDDDDGGRRPRPLKKARLADNLAALAKNKETQPFAVESNANMMDDDNEFAYLNQDQDHMETDVQEPEEPEEREQVSHATVRAELLKIARQGDIRAFNPDDVSWLERNDSSEDEMDADTRVREVPLDRREEAARRPGANVNGEEPVKRTESMQERDRVRLATWGKVEKASSRAGAVIGRNNGGSAAVTGHGKPKAQAGAAGSRDGSFRGTRAATASRNAKSNAKLAKAPSVLSAVSSRRSKFAN
ncbi:MRC1-like domain-containing protein [Lenzites betulinus]|nr:MRC1-like domain-containing protein [Lenzites betulinus]